MRFRLLKALHLSREAGPPTLVKRPSVTQPTPLPENYQTERRKSPRRGGPPLEVLFEQADQPMSAKGAWVKNRSAGGLGLSVSEPLPVGTQLRLRPTLAPEGVPCVCVEVKHCRPLLGALDGWLPVHRSRAGRSARPVRLGERPQHRAVTHHSECNRPDPFVRTPQRGPSAYQKGHPRIPFPL